MDTESGELYWQSSYAVYLWSWKGRVAFDRPDNNNNSNIVDL